MQSRPIYAMSPVTMDDQPKISTLPELPIEDEDWLKFLRDEGLDLLSVFRSIRDKSQRQMLVGLTQAIADGQPT